MSLLPCRSNMLLHCRVAAKKQEPICVLRVNGLQELHGSVSSAVLTLVVREGGVFFPTMGHKNHPVLVSGCCSNTKKHQTCPSKALPTAVFTPVGLIVDDLEGHLYLYDTCK